MQRQKKIIKRLAAIFRYPEPIYENIIV